MIEKLGFCCNVLYSVIFQINESPKNTFSCMVNGYEVKSFLVHDAFISD